MPLAFERVRAGPSGILKAVSLRTVCISVLAVASVWTATGQQASTGLMDVMVSELDRNFRVLKEKADPLEEQREAAALGSGKAILDELYAPQVQTHSHPCV